MLLAGLLTLASAADARTPFRQIGTGTVWTDGDRYAALMLSRGPNRIVDAASGATWELPEPAYGCRVAGVAAGHVLWDCDVPLLQELATGTLRELPGWDTYLQWRENEPLGVDRWTDLTGFGDRWVKADLLCPHCPAIWSYIDWHTGALVARVDERAKRVVDLDEPELDVPLCAPLVRKRHASPERPPFRPASFERPWLLRDLSSTSRVLELHRCGRHKPLVAARCKRGGCRSPQLGGGYLTWRDGFDVGAYRVARRRRTLVGRLPRKASGAVIAHTRRTVYAFDDEFRVYAAPLR